MTFSRTTLLTAVVALTCFAAVTEVRACKGGNSGGGYSSRSSIRYSTPQHRYSAPRQSYAVPQHAYTQQSVVRPVAQQPAPLQVVQATQPQVVAPQPQPQPQASAPAAVQMSALQALGGFAPPQRSVAVAQTTTPVHVGQWAATVGNGATVRLSLQADGNFSWIATNPTGAASTFSGNYSVKNGSLTLNRSNDNQQLGGTMTVSGTDTFNFEINGASINFNRS